MNTNHLLTTGQMAHLHEISKRTLQYYDEIGLFSPAIRQDNGYRFYTYSQCQTLEIILTLEELGMKLKDIGHYLAHKSPKNLANLLVERQAHLRQKIRELQLLDTILSEQLGALHCVDAQTPGVVYEIYQAKERLLVTPPLTASDDRTVYQAIASTLKSTDDRHLYCHLFGSLLTEDAWRHQDYTAYSQYYFKSVDSIPSAYCLIKPAGDYLCINWQGDYASLPMAYERLFAYATAHNLILTGDAYENGLQDDLATPDPKAFITQLMIRIQKAR